MRMFTFQSGFDYLKRESVRRTFCYYRFLPRNIKIVWNNVKCIK